MYGKILLMLTLAASPMHAEELLWQWSAILVPPAAADLITTEKAIARGAREVSPLLARTGLEGRIALRVVGLTTVVVAARYLHRRDRKVASWGLVVGVALAQTLAAVHNHRLERGEPAGFKVTIRF
jgi:hypothetical protein